MNPLISVVIPLYNTEKYIEDCVNSILEQEYENIEVIVVNDGSTDRSQSIVESLSRSDNRIKLLNIENNGVSNARNVGISIAEGDYIVFVDADDYISSDYISYMYELARENKSEFVLSLNYFKDNTDNQIESDCIEIWSNSKCTEHLLYPKITVGCWNKMYDLKFLRDNNIQFKKDLFFGEGLRFITDVSQRANSICVGRRKVYYYRLNEDSCTAVHDVSKAKASLNALDSIRENLILKNKGVETALLCHYWINHFLAVRFMRVEKLSNKDKKYRDNCIMYIRRNVHHALLSKAKLKIRLTSIFVAIFPNTSANIFNKIKGQQ